MRGIAKANVRNRHFLVGRPKTSFPIENSFSPTDNDSLRTCHAEYRFV